MLSADSIVLPLLPLILSNTFASGASRNKRHEQNGRSMTKLYYMDKTNAQEAKAHSRSAPPSFAEYLRKVATSFSRSKKRGSSRPK
jgi:hypothetical protein